MKYIIWGAGKRGKWILRFLGMEKVFAFIDSNKEKIGQKFCGKQVISFEEAKQSYHDCVIILTPLEGSDEIADYLESMQFYKFFKLEELPMNIPCDEVEEFSITCSICRELRYGLLGVNLFSIYLYEKMKELHVTVKIVCQENLHADLAELLQKQIRFNSFQEVVEESDELVAADEGYKRKSGHACVSAEEFVMKHLLPCREELIKFKNVHRGKRCFIVATGPSLKVADLNKLHKNGDICISMNRIFNIFDRTEWRPDYYMVGDKEMIEDLADEIANLKLQNKFIATEPKCYWNNPASKDSIPYKLLSRGIANKMPAFSEQIENGFCHGTTVTYLCIQLAVYMGFREIYLLGVDFNYTNNVYDFQNHFEGCDTPQNKIRLNAIYPEKTLLAYKAAKKYCEEHDIKIYNATRGGKLEVYDRVDFDSLF